MAQQSRRPSSLLLLVGLLAAWATLYAVSSSLAGDTSGTVGASRGPAATDSWYTSLMHQLNATAVTDAEADVLPPPSTPIRHTTPVPPHTHALVAGSGPAHAFGAEAVAATAPRPTVARGLRSCVLDEQTGVKRCVQAEVQLQGQWKVHIVPPDHALKGFRFHLLVRQGLELHPAVQVVGDATSADFVFYLSTSTKVMPLLNYTDGQGAVHSLRPFKLVVLDEGDGPTYIRYLKDGDYAAYFKRSWVKKHNGTLATPPRRLETRFFPISYSVSDNYTNGRIADERKYSVVCTLRRNHKQPARERVMDWLISAVDRLGVKETSVIGEINHAQRRVISDQYLDLNRQAHIVVTCNPSFWEGDFRTWEAMASGALVFVDQMHTPLADPLVHRQHVILFDVHDQAAFERELEYYLAHPDEARRIAINGYLYAMRHHRTVTRVDYVLRSLHELRQAQLRDIESAMLHLRAGALRAVKAPAAYTKTAPRIKDDPRYAMHLPQQEAPPLLT